MTTSIPDRADASWPSASCGTVARRAVATTGALILLLCVSGCGQASDAKLLAGSCGNKTLAPEQSPLPSSSEVEAGRKVAERYVTIRGNVESSTSTADLDRALLELSTGSMRKDLPPKAELLEDAQSITTTILATSARRATSTHMVLDLMTREERKYRPFQSGTFGTYWSVTLDRVGAAWKVSGFSASSQGPC